ncbi:MAG: hypothetical protein ACSLFP_00435 [Acidimicrobiales bacterium]
MFTTGSKWFFGLGMLSLVLAAAYGWSTGGDRLGPVTLGYWGAVGDHLGYTLLVSMGTLALGLGIIALASRDADPTALAQLAGTEQVPQALAPTHAAYWPVLGAFGASLVVLGLVISNVMFVAGFVVLLAVLVEWMVLAWSDRATGDPEANRTVRARLMAPLEVPLIGAIVLGVAIFAFSRVFLTVSKLGAVTVATVLAAAILGIGVLLATKPRLSQNVVAGVLALSAVGVVALGVVSAARGERIIEHHEPHSEEGEQLEPNIPDGTNPLGATATATEGEEG